jgi:hypothetical protein
MPGQNNLRKKKSWTKKEKLKRMGGMSKKHIRLMKQVAHQSLEVLSPYKLSADLYRLRKKERVFIRRRG